MLAPGLFFKPEDAACKDGSPYPVEWEDRWVDVRDLADGARIIHGGPLLPICGFRSEAYNMSLEKKSGAHQVASGSQHVKGMAWDLRSPAVPAAVLYRELIGAYERRQTFTTVDGRMVCFADLLGGIAFYPVSNWVHVDTYKVDHLRKWSGT